MRSAGPGAPGRGEGDSGVGRWQWTSRQVLPRTRLGLEWNRIDRPGIRVVG